MEHIIAKLLQDFEQGKITRRQLIQGVALTATAASAVSAAPAPLAPAAAAADRPVLKAASVNHLSFDVHDHKKLCDFYSDLFGMKVWGEGVKAGQCHLLVGDTFLTLRDRPAGTPTPRVEHIAIGLEHYDKKLVEEATKSRGIEVEWEAGGSPKIKDPEGFIIQIVPKDNRDA